MRPRLRHRTPDTDQSFDSTQQLAPALRPLPSLRRPDLIPPPSLSLTHLLPPSPSQELSNLAWALATLRYTPDPMWMARFERESAERMSSYAAQNLSNTAWAFACFRCDFEPLWVGGMPHLGLEAPSGCVTCLPVGRPLHCLITVPLSPHTQIPPERGVARGLHPADSGEAPGPH